MCFLLTLISDGSIDTQTHTQRSSGLRRRSVDRFRRRRHMTGLIEFRTGRFRHFDLNKSKWNLFRGGRTTENEMGSIFVHERRSSSRRWTEFIAGHRSVGAKMEDDDSVATISETVSRRRQGVADYATEARFH